MKVKANKEVFIRSKTPYQNNDNKKGILYAGFEIEVVEEIEGQSIADNSKWYKDKNGDYYWSGGFESNSVFKIDLNNNNFQEQINRKLDIISKRFNGTVSYFDLLNIGEEIKQKKGKNTIVGVLDYPIKKWEATFGQRIIEDNFNIQKIGGSHGTLVASIIGANQQMNYGLIGIAPECNFVQLPILYNYKGKKIIEHQILSFLNAKFPLTKIIINASIAYLEEEINSEIINFYQDIANKHIVVASAGENKQLLAQNNLQFPSRINDIISVGVVSQDFIEDNDNLNFNKGLDLILKNYTYAGITHINENNFDFIQRDSAATAIVSGIISLLLSSMKEDVNLMTKTDILNKLKPYCISINEALHNNKLTLINPKL